MTYAELRLDQDDYTLGTMPENFQTYCARSKCQVLIRPGTAVKRYDAATYVHLNCPTTPHRTFAPHKYGDAR